MTSSWSRITDSSSRSIVQVCWCFSIVLFQRKSEGSCLQTTCSVGSWREKSVCPSPTNWPVLCFGESYLAPPLTGPVQNALISSYWRSGSPSASHLSVQNSWETNRGTEQFSWHTVCFTLSSCRLCGDVFLFPAALQRFQSHLHLLFCGMCVWKLLHLSRVDVLASSDDLVLQTSFTMQQQHRLFRLSVSLITCSQEYR